VATLRRTLHDSLQAFGDAFRHPGLRRLQLAWVGSNLGAWMGGLALAVYAYREDGAFAVGVIALVRMLAAGAVAPFLGTLGDRYPRVRVMVLSDLVRVVAVAAMAAVAATDGPSIVIYTLAVASGVAGTAFHPAQAALVPTLARTPAELTASNVTASTVEGVAIFVGPALAGVLLSVTSVELVFVLTSATFLWSAGMVRRIEETWKREAPEGPTSFLRETLAGISVLTGNRHVALLVGLFAAQTFVDGALGVLTVVLALEALDVGESGLGLLNSVTGAGALIGAVVAAGLVARGRLATDFGVGMVLWGVPLGAIALWLDPVVALIALTVVGVGNTIVDVAGDTLLQRAVPDELLARVFAIMESLMLVAVGIGSVVAPTLESLFGIRWALALTGALLPALTLLSWRVLARIDADAPVHTREVDLLRAIPIFAPLPPATLECLAGKLAGRRVPGGETVFHHGDPGDAFYVVAAGNVLVLKEDEPPIRLGAGGYFGEIALLRDIPRTATVEAETDVELLRLDRETFVNTVTRDAEASAAADAVVGARLGVRRPGLSAV
jgi:MFS family permease